MPTAANTAGNAVGSGQWQLAVGSGSWQWAESRAKSQEGVAVVVAGSLWTSGNTITIAK